MLQDQFINRLLLIVVFGVAYIYTMKSTKFKYEIKASYPYTLTGEHGKYEAIDFSEGPNLQKDSFIGNLKIVDINPPFITFEKVF